MALPDTDDGAVGPPAAGVTAVDIDGRFSIYNPLSHRVLTLNATASDVWRLCDGEYDQEAVAQLLAAAYGQPVEAIRADVFETIELFAGEGLLASGGRATGPE